MALRARSEKTCAQKRYSLVPGSSQARSGALAFRQMGHHIPRQIPALVDGHLRQEQPSAARPRLVQVQSITADDNFIKVVHFDKGRVGRIARAQRRNLDVDRGQFFFGDGGETRIARRRN